MQWTHELRHTENLECLVEPHQKETLRPVPKLSPEEQNFFTKIAEIPDFNDPNSIYEKYGIKP